MINSKFKIKKLINLIIEVFIYSLFGLCIGAIFKPEFISFISVIKAIFPVIYCEYWFMTTYIIMYLLSPFMNKLFNVLNKNELKKLIFILIIIEVVIPTLTTSEFKFSSVLWFMTLYIIGAYINKFSHKFLENQKQNIIIIVLSYLLISISIIIFDFLGMKIKIISLHATYFAKINSILCVLCSISLFLYFKNMKIFYSNIINTISSTTLGIYLIHSNTFIGPIIWESIFKCATYADSKFLIINALIAIVCVFIACSIIDLIRQVILDKLVNKKIEKILSKIEILSEKIKIIE